MVKKNQFELHRESSPNAKCTCVVMAVANDRRNECDSLFLTNAVVGRASYICFVRLPFSITVRTEVNIFCVRSCVAGRCAHADTEYRTAAGPTTYDPLRSDTNALRWSRLVFRTTSSRLVFKRLSTRRYFQDASAGYGVKTFPWNTEQGDETYGKRRGARISSIFCFITEKRILIGCAALLRAGENVCDGVYTEGKFFFFFFNSNA